MECGRKVPSASYPSGTCSLPSNLSHSTRCHTLPCLSRACVFRTQPPQRLPSKGPPIRPALARYTRTNLISYGAAAWPSTLPIGVRTKLTPFLVIRPHNSVLSVNFSFLHENVVKFFDLSFSRRRRRAVIRPVRDGGAGYHKSWPQLHEATAAQTASPATFNVLRNAARPRRLAKQESTINSTEGTGGRGGVVTLNELQMPPCPCPPHAARRTPHAERFDSDNKGHPLSQQQSRGFFPLSSSQSAATVITYPVGVAGGRGRQPYLFVGRTTSQGWN
jgi:hypothetical protein